MHGLAAYVKERLPFAWDVSLANSVDCYVSDWLYFAQCLFPVLKLHISVTPKLVKKVYNEAWFIKVVSSWLYCSGNSKLWAWTFLHTTWTLPWTCYEYQPLFEGMIAKLTVTNNLSIIFNSEQKSGKYSVWWLSKKVKLFWKIPDKSSVKVKILANVPGKEMITNKQGLKFFEMIKPLITFFQNFLFQAGTFRVERRDCIWKIWYIFGLKYQKMI